MTMNIETLQQLSKFITVQQTHEISDPAPLVEWLEQRRRKASFSSELIPLSQIDGWTIKADTGDIFHNSGQFFSIQGVRTTSCGLREVNSWDQPIYNQVEGGILSLIAHRRDDTVKFLLYAKAEPGNIGNLQFAPTIQCTWSNIKQAHKGKRPPFSSFISGESKSTLIYEALHNEEGGRFWRKSNSNRIYLVNGPWDYEYNQDHFIWATLSQIKNLCLIDNVVSPFVKTIIAPL